MSKRLIDLQHITKSYDGQVVLDDLNLYIRENEFLTLLGPSGGSAGVFPWVLASGPKTGPCAGSCGCSGDTLWVVGGSGSCVRSWCSELS